MQKQLIHSSIVFFSKITAYFGTKHVEGEEIIRLLKQKKTHPRLMDYQEWLKLYVYPLIVEFCY